MIKQKRKSILTILLVVILLATSCGLAVAVARSNRALDDTALSSDISALSDELESVKQELANSSSGTQLYHHEICTGGSGTQLIYAITTTEETAIASPSGFSFSFAEGNRIIRMFIGISPGSVFPVINFLSGVSYDDNDRVVRKDSVYKVYTGELYEFTIDVNGFTDTVTPL